MLTAFVRVARAVAARAPAVAIAARGFRVATKYRGMDFSLATEENYKLGLSNNSEDNISSACVAVSGQKLKDFLSQKMSESDKTIVDIVCDDNGSNRHLAAQKIIDFACRALNLETIPGFPLSTSSLDLSLDLAKAKSLQGADLQQHK